MNSAINALPNDVGKIFVEHFFSVKTKQVDPLTMARSPQDREREERDRRERGRENREREQREREERERERTSFIVFERFARRPTGGLRRFRWGRNLGCYVTKLAV
jgi:hypothetical protein